MLSLQFLKVPLVVFFAHRNALLLIRQAFSLTKIFHTGANNKMECVLLLESPVWWECGWHCFLLGMQVVVRHAVAHPISGTSFWAYFFTAVQVFPKIRATISQLAACPSLCCQCLCCATKLPFGFLSSSISILTVTEPTVTGKRQLPTAKPGIQLFCTHL